MAKQSPVKTITDTTNGMIASYSPKDAQSKQLAQKALLAYRGKYQAQGMRDTWKNIAPHISVREEFTRGDYEYFRPSEAISNRQQELISYCMEAYRKIGIVRNVIDLMGDFGSQGITLNHPNPRIQDFYRKWFNKVKGKDRSERFLNLLYRCGNVIARRRVATIGPLGNQRFTALGDKVPTDGTMPEKLTVKAGDIPFRYTFLNPLTLQPIGESLAQFIGCVGYALKLPPKLVNTINYPKNAIEKSLVESLPTDVIAAAKSATKLLPLNNRQLLSYFYKKDDWQIWADPMIRAILDDLLLLEKMKLADLAALDGVISQIRIWKLGHLNDAHPEASFFPTAGAISKLNDILLSNPGGGVFDLIWGPDIELEISETNVHQFLGQEKYAPTLNSIYEGLGVPPTLTGSSNGGGMTNNNISLKTMIQRLEYGRAILVDFWSGEIELVRQAMGFRLPATVSFDRMILSDEVAEKALLVQLADRNLISVEALQKRMGEIPELEKIRMRREMKEQDDDLMAPKVGPFQPDKQFELIRAALTRGFITPKQSGIDVKEEFEVPPFVLQVKKSANTGGGNDPNVNGGQPQQGRPRNSKDKSQRKARTPKALGEDLDETAWFFTRLTWAKQAQKEIADLLQPALLSVLHKDNLRQLTDAEAAYLEDIKFAALAKTAPFSKISEKSVYIMLEGDMSIPKDYQSMALSLVKSAADKLNRTLVLDEIRQIQAVAYSLLIGGDCGENKLRS